NRHGQLRCLGSIQHLRERYGTGYQLEMQTRTDDTDLARSFVAQVFPRAVLLEHHLEHHQRRHLRFAFPSDSVKAIADVFEAIEANRSVAGIDDYSLGQTSLEQASIAPSPTSTSRRSGSASSAASPTSSVLSWQESPSSGSPGILHLAWFATFPFGRMPLDPRVTVRRPHRTRLIVNGVATFVTAPIAAVFHLHAAVLLAMTIWLYPYAKMHFKLMALAFTPAYW
ncbi:hypothetical protein BDK51DRAFT_31919, partial [Blyttiomyces helicus]